MDAIAPGSTIALRIPAALATAAAVVVAGLIARELGCDRRAQGFSAAAQATALWTTRAQRRSNAAQVDTLGDRIVQDLVIRPNVILVGPHLVKTSTDLRMLADGKATHPLRLCEGCWRRGVSPSHH